MSKYTIQLRTLVENGFPIFDFDYPIFDPAYKPVLEQKIIDWYYFREIGLETPAQFKHFLKSKLNVIMPYYNQWYESNEGFKHYDPYKNKNVTTTDTRTSTSDSEGKTNTSNSGSQTVDTNNTSTGSQDTTETSSGTTSSKETYSDTPQAKLQALDYATNYTETEGDTGGTQTGTSTSSGTETGKTTSSGSGSGTQNSTGTITTTEEYISTIAGHDGMKYPTDILMGLRQSFVNIDKQIIDELSVLFLNIA